MYSQIHQVNGLGVWLCQDIGLFVVWHCIVIMGLVKGMVFLKLYCMSGLRNYMILYLKPMTSALSDLRFLGIMLFFCHLFFQITLGSIVIPSAYQNGFSFRWCLTVFLTSAEGRFCQHWKWSTSTHYCAEVQLEIMWHHSTKNNEKNHFNNDIDKVYQLLSTSTSPSQFFVTLSIHIEIHRLASTHFSLGFNMQAKERCVKNFDLGWKKWNTWEKIQSTGKRILFMGFLPKKNPSRLW